MLNINLIRTKPEWVRQQLLKRGYQTDFTDLLGFDIEKRKAITKNEVLRAKRNTVSADIAKIKRGGAGSNYSSPEAQNRLVDRLVAEMRNIGDKIANGDKKIAKLDAKIFDLIAALPNIPADDVAAGGKEKNRVIQSFGNKPKFSFSPKNHVDLCTSLGLIDYQRAAKISGTKTWVYTGVGAMLEWALLNYFVDFHIRNKYTFVMVPHLLNYQSGVTAGQFPKFADDVFITNFDKDIKQSRFLLPTAETALINLHRDEIIPADKLPIKYAGYSPCYRKEAGSYRTDERGMVRGFQFNKVEMFIFCKAADTAKFFDELVKNAEKLVEGLGLHYQTVALAAGDCASAMAKTYDIEVFIPSMDGYKEVSSISACHDYQARRGNIRTQRDTGPGYTSEKEFVHTLNASGLATSRLIPAIVEQFQNADGSVTVPEVLHKYMHGVKVIHVK